MDMDWQKIIIGIPQDTNNWGPYTFDFKNSGNLLIPKNCIITSVDVKAYKDFVDKTVDLTTVVETTNYIIDGVSIVGGRYVNVYFQHNEAAKGMHTLIFYVDIDQPESVRPFYFYGIRIY